MRVDVRKYLFVGVAAEREEFFRKAQERGIIEFIDRSHTKVRETPQKLQHLSQAIKVLRGLPPVEQEETSDWSRTDSIVEKIIFHSNRLENLAEERRMLRQEISRVEVFGDFSLDDIKTIESEGKRVLQFFVSKKSSDIDPETYPELIHLASEHGLDYFVSIAPKATHYEGMIEMRIDQPLGVLQKRSHEVERQVDVSEAKLVELSKYSDFLHGSLVVQLDHHNLDTAQGFVDYGLNEHVFSVEGWVATDKREQLQELIQECRVHGEEVAIEDEDRIPTALTNEGMARIGEDLVHIYDTPGIADKDPSMWVLWSFALFFALILSDGGYGLIFLAMAGFMYWKFPKATGMAKRIMNLTTILAVSCILWGVLSNSFFGIKFDLGSPMRSFSLVQHLAEKKAGYHLREQDEVFVEWTNKFPAAAGAATGYDFLESAKSTDESGHSSFEALDKFSDNVMLELALLIGVLHISLSFLRNIRESWAGLGWIAFMAGAYLFFPSMLNATSMLHYVLCVDKVAGAEAGLQLLYGGIGSAVVLAVIQHKAAGTIEIMNLIQVFSDVLSYLRLYALGLAGSMMSSTFNQIGSEVTIVAGVLIILIGHTVNIVLSIMGGVIHGLRLNFLEWYHYSFEGGGKLFNPLRRMGAD